MQKQERDLGLHVDISHACMVVEVYANIIPDRALCLFFKLFKHPPLTSTVKDLTQILQKYSVYI